MQEPLTSDVHWLPAEALRGAWESLCTDLGRIAEVHSAYAELVPGGIAHVRLAQAGTHLSDIDRRVMACLAADPLHRRDAGNDEVEIALRFRSWWRESVPFLIDPDGAMDHYVFEHVEAGSVPPPPEA